MSQLIEGVDNEVTLAIIMFTGAAAIAVPWYFFRPNSRSIQQGTQQDATRRSSSRTGEDQTATISTPSNRRADEASHVTMAGSPTSESVLTTPSFETNEFNNSGLDNRQTVSGSEGEHQADDGNISVKIKHNTTDTIYSVPKTMTLINFKRHCYAAEMEQGKNVRLIYNGRILAGDHYTLNFLGINNGCVIHAQISEHQSTQGTHTSVDFHDLDIGFLFIPLMSLAIILCWVFVISFDDLFGVASIVILSFLSVLFILLAFVL